MASRAEQRLAEALQKRERHAHAYHGRHMRYAIVRGVSPLVVELEDSSDPMDEDELLLGHTVKQYDADYGLAEDDTLVLQEMRDGRYVAIEVLHDADVTPSSTLTGA